MTLSLLKWSLLTLSFLNFCGDSVLKAIISLIDITIRPISGPLSPKWFFPRKFETVCFCLFRALGLFDILLPPLLEGSTVVGYAIQLLELYSVILCKLAVLKVRRGQTFEIFLVSLWKRITSSSLFEMQWDFVSYYFSRRTMCRNMG